MTSNGKPLFPSVAEQHYSKCVHWAGLMGPGMVDVHRCDAGVEYASVSTESRVNMRSLPCFRDQEHITTCAARWFPTREESEAHAAESNKQTARVLGAYRAVATAVGKKRGITGAVDCPVCEKPGALHYSVAAVNGHIWGKCATEGCVSWMQ